MLKGWRETPVSDLIQKVSFIDSWESPTSINSLMKTPLGSWKGDRYTLRDWRGAMKYEWFNNLRFDTTLKTFVVTCHVDVLTNFQILSKENHVRDLNWDRFRAEVPPDETLSVYLVKMFKRVSKMDKSFNVTINNLLKTIEFFFQANISQAEIKDFMTAANSSVRKVYLYRADTEIETHYNYLYDKCNINSCMTKGSSTYSDNHYIDISSIEDAKSHGYNVVRKGNRKTVFTHNIESYNGDESDLALGLVSYFSPEELAKQTSYPFIGRAILKKRDLPEDMPYQWVRYYGHEGIALPEKYKIKSFKGCKIKAYVCPGKVYGMKDTHIIPYIDGEHNVIHIKDDDAIQYDEIGRPFKLGTVIPAHRDNFDDYMRSLERNTPKENGVFRKDCYYRLQQDSWTSREMHYWARCNITGIEGNSETLIWSNKFKNYVLMRFANLNFTTEQEFVIMQLNQRIKDLESELSVSRSDNVFKRSKLRTESYRIAGELENAVEQAVTRHFQWTPYSMPQEAIREIRLDDEAD